MRGTFIHLRRYTYNTKLRPIHWSNFLTDYYHSNDNKGGYLTITDEDKIKVALVVDFIVCEARKVRSVF